MALPRCAMALDNKETPGRTPHETARFYHGSDYHNAPCVADFVAGGGLSRRCSPPLPARNLNELMGWLKNTPNKATAGTAGPGSGSHVAGVFFQNQTGTGFSFVPYRGAGPALNDLMAGHIDLMFDQATNSLPQVRGGNVRAYAVTSRSRLASPPDIPTVDEAGLPDLYTPYLPTILAPQNTPRQPA